jgi:hypothetical protein
VHAFLSYSHKDFALKQRFVEYFAALSKLYGITLWHDDRLHEQAGQALDPAITKAINAARLHLLLVTPAMFNSNYIWTIEIPAMKASAATSGGLLVPIILEDCSWRALVAGLVAIPLDLKNNLVPITDWRPNKKGFVAAVNQLERTLVPRFGLTAQSPLGGTP